MNEFYEGLIAGVAMLGGLCAFNYWVFNLMEKRLEQKLDSVNENVSKIANELMEDRRDKANLYNFVLQNNKK